jgi:hypothetical protein
MVADVPSADAAVMAVRPAPVAPAATAPLMVSPVAPVVASG